MKKTVICHFYNEEFLLPWWLMHHKAIFDHGIMIDYASDDRSCEIIRELCPSWEIHPSRNEYFDGDKIDEEVMDIERELTGWRATLNVTEFLYGNTDHLDDRSEDTQYLITNYVFVDMQDPDKGSTELSHNTPLYEQRYWGYWDNANDGHELPAGTLSRMNRSIHNFPVKYTGGRHWPRTDCSFDDLVIFYYGYVDASDKGLERKAQIRFKTSEYAARKNPTTQMPPGARFELDDNGQVIVVGLDGTELNYLNYPGGWGTHHNYNKEQFIRQYKEDQQPMSKDMRNEIKNILEHNKRCTGQEW
jgi:hypothetical protein